MPRGGILSRRPVFVCAAGLAAALLAALAATTSSDAAYPGKPGRIAFKRDDGNGLQIWTVSTDGKSEVQLTHNNFASAGDPSWSIDGKRIVYRGRPGGMNSDGEIFVINVTAKKVKQITTDDTFDDDEPNFLPNGKIIFQSDHPAGSDTDIWVMNANGKNQHELPGASSDDEREPAIS